MITPLDKTICTLLLQYFMFSTWSSCWDGWGTGMMERVSEMTFFGNVTQHFLNFWIFSTFGERSQVTSYGFLCTFLLSFTIFCNLVRWEFFRSTYPLPFFFFHHFIPISLHFIITSRKKKTKLYSHHFGSLLSLMSRFII